MASCVQQQPPPAPRQKLQPKRQEAVRTASGGPAGGTQPSRRPHWLQAVDAATGRPYYFQAGSQHAQWDAPPADATCLPTPFAWSAQIHKLQPAPPPPAPAEHGHDPAAQRPLGPAAVPPHDPAAAAADGLASGLAAVALGPPAAGSAPGTAAEQDGRSSCDAAAPQTPGKADGSAEGGGRADGTAAAGEWVRGPLPRTLWKYWMQRYTLFARFDDGILLDEEGWFSVTPEAIAR